MSNPYLDYDYPINEKKPVQNVNFNNLLQNPNKNNILLSSFDQHYQKTNIPTRVSHGPQSSASSSTKNGGPNSTGIASSITLNHVSDDSLNFVIPPNEVVSGSKGIYYDVPKNIPVNPRFARKTSLPNLGIPKFPVSQVVRNEPFRAPVLPKKSSLVIRKISNYSSSDNYMNMQENLATLSKNNTSKALPQLPNQSCVDKSLSITKTMPNHTAPNNISSGSNIYDIVKNYQQTDIFKEQDVDDCDYEYDYVCLESKKKLEHDDQNIKLLLSKDLQPKYERMVLNLENLNINYLDKLGANKKTDSHYNRFLLQQYRPLLIQATNTFHNWTKFTMEAIDSKYSPEVYFNFVKHILLSGQNLLTIIKSLNRHIQHDMQNHEIVTFSNQFLENLKQIVLRTKKASGDYSAIHDLTTSIECASQLVTNLVKHYRSLL